MRFGVSALAAVLVAVCPPLATLQAAPPLEAYGELPAVEEMVLSPSGNRFAAVTTLEGKRIIAILSADMRLLKRLEIGDIKVRSIEFATDDLLLIRRSMTQDLGFGFAQDKYEFYQALTLPLDATEVGVAFGDRAEMINATFGYYGIRMVGGYPKAYYGGIKQRKESFNGGYVFDHGRPGLYEIDLLTNKSREVDGAAPEGFDREWLVGPDGTVVARLDVSDADGDWILRNGADTLLARGDSHNGAAGLVSIGRTAETVIFSARAPEAIESRWIEIPVDGSSEGAEFLPDIDIAKLYGDRRTGLLVGYREEDKDPIFFDPSEGTRAAAVRKAFPKLNPAMIDWTAGLDQVLVGTNGNGDSGSYYIVDLVAKRANSIGLERPAIEPEDVGAISTVTYAAQDGLEMDGILTLPPGREARNLPLVMLPHGGPAGHDVAGFDWWAQAFASRGYAVFQPNFRGSTGRDAEFRRAGDGEWGGKMQTDISDGLAKLAAEGIVDPKRACIVGASYGGYAALAGVTLQNGLYRCAAAVAGVSDLSLLNRIERRESGHSRMAARSLKEQLGPSSEFRARSPRFQADKADAPILLVHGRDDTVVPFTHSEKMADALKDAGKPYQLVELAGEDHWLSLGATRMAMLNAVVGFVEKHNPPD